MKKKIFIYDTTLRDGAQAEGVSFSPSGKLRLAERLDEFGVDYIEGGYAGSNRKDMEFFHQAADLGLKHARIVAFGSTRRKGKNIKDDPFVSSLIAAPTETVTIYGKSWLLHVHEVLRATPRQNIEMVRDTIAFLKDHGRQVFFDAEHFFDGFKDSPEYAQQVLSAAVEAGADCLVLCDTNGGTMPHEINEITSKVCCAFDVPIGIHVHNDCGMAVANSIEAVRAGAVQVQGTINGYGERCGNANLCTIVPNLQIKLGYNCVKKSELRHLRELALFVDDLVNCRPDIRAPFIGHSAFSHKGGPHVNAVQKNPSTFEHIDPANVGNERHVLVSELSGGSNVLLKAIEVGIGRDESVRGKSDILAALKDLEHRGYAFESADGSFRILVQKVLKKHKSFFDLDGFRVIIEKRGKDEPCISEATVKVRVNGEIEQTVAEGDGPVNALDGALRKALFRFYPSISNVQLTDFRVRILDPEEATAATTRVLIESTDGDDTWGTVGVSGNIIEASWEALFDSVEYKLFRDEEKRQSKSRKKKKK